MPEDEHDPVVKVENDRGERLLAFMLYTMLVHATLEPEVRQDDRTLRAKEDAGGPPCSQRACELCRRLALSQTSSIHVNDKQPRQLKGRYGLP